MIMKKVALKLLEFGIITIGVILTLITAGFLVLCGAIFILCDKVDDWNDRLKEKEVT
jgi:hypothetical protein